MLGVKIHQDYASWMKLKLASNYREKAFLLLFFNFFFLCLRFVGKQWNGKRINFQFNTRKSNFWDFQRSRARWKRKSFSRGNSQLSNYFRNNWKFENSWNWNRSALWYFNTQYCHVSVTSHNANFCFILWAHLSITNSLFIRRNRCVET
jgi:hypothetical protein